MTCRISLCLAVLCLWVQPALSACTSHTVVDQSSGWEVRGIEDIAWLPETDSVLISAYDRRENSEGGVYLLDGMSLSHASNQTLSGTPLFTADDIGGPIRPHGIALHDGQDGITRLAVLNRRAWNGDRVTDLLVFELSEDHRRAELTVQTRSSALCAANDLVFVDEESFLVTIDHGACEGAGRAMEDVFNLARGKVLLVSPIGIRELLSAIRFPNGLVLDEERRWLWVASTRGKELLGFQLPKRLTGAFQDNTPDLRIALSAAPDNLSLTNDGMVLAAGHQSLLAFAAYRAQMPWPSPPGSAVELINPQNGTAELILTLRDPLLNGASSAVRRHSTILTVGGFDQKLAECELQRLQ